MISTIHFAVVEHGGDVEPLCGSWGDGTSWTTVPAAVRCAACGGRIRADAKKPRGERGSDRACGGADGSRGWRSPRHVD